MKVLILFAAIILLGACASTPSIREKVTGTYAAKQGGGIVGLVFREDGMYELYINLKKQREDKWGIVGGKIFAETEYGYKMIFRTNKDDSLTEVGKIDKDGKRKDRPKGSQELQSSLTYKKIQKQEII